ncbi:MAG: peptide ABC transporter substrate-binding protein, partial [Oscillospiraceae bacterium]|nr:peptide ABC transporter substrate-binding protein [Oscillospiraceae bacterium]
MKKFLSLLLAMAMVLSLAACGSGDKPTESTAPDASKAPSESSAPAGATSMAVCIASEPDTIDPALNSAVDGATLVSHLFSGLAKW